MKEIKLREVIRKQIIKRLSEAPDSFTSKVGSSVSGKLGGAKAALNQGLKKIDVSRVSKLPRSQKINLLTALLQNVGVSAKDFEAIKSRVGRQLSSADNATEESIEEAEGGYEMQKAKGGVTSRDLGGASAVNRAKPFLSAISSLTGKEKQKAIGYALSQMGVNAQDFDGMKTALKTTIKKYK